MGGTLQRGLKLICVGVFSVGQELNIKSYSHQDYGRRVLMAFSLRGQDVEEVDLVSIISMYCTQRRWQEYFKGIFLVPRL